MLVSRSNLIKEQLSGIKVDNMYREDKCKWSPKQKYPYCHTRSLSFIVLFSLSSREVSFTSYLLRLHLCCTMRYCRFGTMLWVCFVLSREWDVFPPSSLPLRLSLLPFAHDSCFVWTLEVSRLTVKLSRYDRNKDHKSNLNPPALEESTLLRRPQLLPWNRRPICERGRHCSLSHMKILITRRKEPKRHPLTSHVPRECLMPAQHQHIHGSPIA